MDKTIECSSTEGVTIGIIDAIITMINLLHTRDLKSDAIKEALKDLQANGININSRKIIEDKLLKTIQAHPENVQRSRGCRHYSEARMETLHEVIKRLFPCSEFSKSLASLKEKYIK